MLREAEGSSKLRDLFLLELTQKGKDAQGGGEFLSLEGIVLGIGSPLDMAVGRGPAWGGGGGLDHPPQSFRLSESWILPFLLL